MLSWESAFRKEYTVGLSRDLFTLHDVVEERLAGQNAFAEDHVPTDAFDAAIKIQQQNAEDDAGEDEERGQKQEWHRKKELKETSEILALQRMLPDLLQQGRLQEAEGAILYFLDRNPRSADGFVLLAEACGCQKNQMGALSAVWGAIYNSPGNRRLLRLLAQYEESFLMERCEIPLQFKVRALQAPDYEAIEESGQSDTSSSLGFGQQEAPVFVAKQGCHTVAFANRDMNPGDLVFKEKPFVCTPLMLEAGQIFSSCFHCLQEREDPGRAFSCPVSPHSCPFVFCSWDCLMRNGRLHAVECKCMPMIHAAAKESGLHVTSVLHVFRTLVKSAMQRELLGPRDESAEFTCTTDVATQLLSLNSYEAAVRQAQPELLKRLLLLSRRLQQGLPSSLLLYLSEKELVHLILVVLQYSLFVSATSAAAAVERKNPECTLGRILAPATALLHHSCVPTATICLQEDGQVAVRALTFIPSGGFICLSVEEDLFKPQKERKAIESPPRVFGCGCVRCTENDEGGRLLRGIRCFKCVRGFLCPAKGRAILDRLKAYEETGICLVPAKQTMNAPVKLTVAKAGGVSFTKIIQKKSEEKQGGQEEVVERPGEMQSKGESLKPADEQWLCNSCGHTSPKVSKACDAMEKDILRRQTQAEADLVKGSKQLAAKGYGDLVEHYGSKVHPQHAVLFNAHTILAGLLASQGGKGLPRALILLRRATVAAETVLPVASMTKVHLYLKLAELTYQAMKLDKQCRRGPSLPPEKIMEPLFCALWNCVACLGREASLSVVICLRLRRFAALLGICTPPLFYVPVVRTEDVFVALYRSATNSTAATPEQIRSHFLRDPMFLAVALLRRGLHFPLALELFRAMKGVHHLPTGFSLLGLACLHSQTAIVSKLLEMGYDLFSKSHLGMTPLLAMCAARGSGLSLTKGPPSRFSGAVGAEEAQLEILRLMLRHCDDLDTSAPVKTDRKVQKSGSPTCKGPLQVKGQCVQNSGNAEQTRHSGKTHVLDMQPNRRRLLFASAHKFLGRSHALHFAASNGKARLCRQLLAAGSVVGVLNAESATPLHLACLAGEVETVKVLLDHGASINSATLRGETPLVLAAYWLHGEVTSVLLERGADCSVVTRAEGMTVLHAVVAGVLRQTKPLFRGLSWEGDPAAIALEGLSMESAARGVYTRGGASLSPEEIFVDLQLPSSIPEDSDLFLFPDELLSRVKKAQQLLLSLMPHCDVSTYTQHTRNGLTAADLLLHSWDSFQSKRNKLLKNGDLRLAPLTDKERRQVEEQWHYAVHLIYILRGLLRPHHFTAEQVAKAEARTPRMDQLNEKHHQRLLADAPWFFPEEVRQATTKAKAGVSPTGRAPAAG
ncbi:uncharacterized protein LOC34620342 [Cyclospora cayetanensis]|uniref:Uncharacterized protein LOC34620342 n=1 Tax=Cyclospora cayetanensis TaxID=88456 RepID=A0A6P6RQ04_9EIME|nr:uncharacterized protein LOC34620342 [Cyclospora cayetanensis]